MIQKKTFIFSLSWPIGKSLPVSVLVLDVVTCLRFRSRLLPRCSDYICRSFIVSALHLIGAMHAPVHGAHDKGPC
jgi:branched-subunit amino acid transport protein AzlD